MPRLDEAALLGLSGATSGAMAGMALGGPWGAAVGGAAGLGVGVFDAFRNERLSEEARLQQEALDRELKEAGKLALDAHLRDVAVGQGLAVQSGKQEAQEYARRTGINPGQAMDVQQQVLQGVNQDYNARRASAQLAAHQASLAERQQILSEYGTAQALRDNATADAGAATAAFGQLAGAAMTYDALRGINAGRQVAGQVQPAASSIPQNAIRSDEEIQQRNADLFAAGASPDGQLQRGQLLLDNPSYKALGPGGEDLTYDMFGSEMKMAAAQRPQAPPPSPAISQGTQLDYSLPAPPAGFGGALPPAPSPAYPSPAAAAHEPPAVAPGSAKSQLQPVGSAQVAPPASAPAGAIVRPSAAPQADVAESEVVPRISPSVAAAQQMAETSASGDATSVLDEIEEVLTKPGLRAAAGSMTPRLDVNGTPLMMDGKFVMSVDSPESVAMLKGSKLASRFHFVLEATPDQLAALGME